MKKTTLKRIAAIAAVAAIGGTAAAGVMADAEKTIKLQIGNPKMTVDGTEKNIDDEGTAPIIDNDRTMLPIRAVIEEMGGTVDWDETTKTVTVKAKTADGDETADDKTDEAEIDALELVKDLPTTQVFSFDEVPDEDIAAILNAGINTPSASNKQPWHFSAVTDYALLEQIDYEGNVARAEANGTEAPAEPTGELPSTRPGRATISCAPLAIIVSCEDDNELNAGLATIDMFVTARLLGYGTKIITSPTTVINGEKADEYREKLGIPEDMHAAAVLLIGKEDLSLTTDAVSAATTRNPFEDMATIIR